MRAPRSVDDLHPQERRPPTPYPHPPATDAPRCVSASSSPLSSKRGSKTSADQRRPYFDVAARLLLARIRKDDGSLVAVFLTRSVLRSKFEALNATPGDTLYFRYDGARQSEQGRTYHAYALSSL